MVRTVNGIKRRITGGGLKTSILSQFVSENNSHLKGSGLHPKIQKRIVRKQKTKKSVRGSGLNPAIMKKLVEIQNIAGSSGGWQFKQRDHQQTVLKQNVDEKDLIFWGRTFINNWAKNKDFNYRLKRLFLVLKATSIRILNAIRRKEALLEQNLTQSEQEALSAAANPVQDLKSDLRSKIASMHLGINKGGINLLRTDKHSIIDFWDKMGPEVTEDETDNGTTRYEIKFNMEEIISNLADASDEPRWQTTNFDELFKYVGQAYFFDTMKLLYSELASKEARMQVKDRISVFCRKFNPMNKLFRAVSRGIGGAVHGARIRGLRDIVSDDVNFEDTPDFYGVPYVRRYSPSQLKHHTLNDRIEIPENAFISITNLSTRNKMDNELYPTQRKNGEPISQPERDTEIMKKDKQFNSPSPPPPPSGIDDDDDYGMPTGFDDGDQAAQSSVLAEEIDSKMIPLEDNKEYKVIRFNPPEGIYQETTNGVFSAPVIFSYIPKHKQQYNKNKKVTQRKEPEYKIVSDDDDIIENPDHTNDQKFLVDDDDVDYATVKKFVPTGPKKKLAKRRRREGKGKKAPTRDEAKQKADEIFKKKGEPPNKIPRKEYTLRTRKEEPVKELSPAKINQLLKLYDKYVILLRDYESLSQKDKRDIYAEALTKKINPNYEENLRKQIAEIERIPAIKQKLIEREEQQKKS